MSVSLKKWIASILESIVTKHEDCTLVTSVATGGYIRAYRTGNVVMLRIQNVSLKAFSVRTQIATIPEGYRPVEESYGLLNNQPVTEYVLANPNGALSVQASAYAGNRWGTLIYIVGGVLRNPVIAMLTAISKIGGGLNARKSENSCSKGSDLSHWTRNLCDFYKKRYLILNLLWNDQLRHFEGRIHTYRSDKRFLKPGSASLLFTRNINVWEHCEYWCKSLFIRQHHFLAIDNHSGAIHSQRFCSVIAASERGWAVC